MLFNRKSHVDRSEIEARLSIALKAAVRNPFFDVDKFGYLSTPLAEKTTGNLTMDLSGSSCVSIRIFRQADEDVKASKAHVDMEILRQAGLVFWREVGRQFKGPEEPLFDEPYLKAFQARKWEETNSRQELEKFFTVAFPDSFEFNVWGLSFWMTIPQNFQSKCILVPKKVEVMQYKKICEGEEGYEEAVAALAEKQDEVV